MQLASLLESARPAGVPAAYFRSWMERHRSHLEAVIAANLPAAEEHRPNTSTLDLLTSYDTIVVAFSGGKDSLACVLELIRLLNGDRSRIELWHHLVDGAESGESLFDWPVTSAYCRAVADALGLPLYFSWREGGFLGEMLRDNQPTGPVVTEMPDGSLQYGGGNGPPGTRMRFPQIAADLKVRWCSSYLKIDPAATAIRIRWPTGKVLLITGERRQESSPRSKYARVEQHKSTTNSRRVDQWRPILDWPETQVWEVIRAAGIVLHPAYQIGHSRLSCACCIFGGPLEWATFKLLRPKPWRKLAKLESTFRFTMKRNESIPELTTRGVPFENAHLAELQEKVNAREWSWPILVDPADWELPAGAFRRSAGPT